MPDDPKIKKLQESLAVARGDEPADLAVRNGTLVNVFSGTLERADVAVHNGRVAGIGAYSGRIEIDAAGKFVLPGFIEGHMHIESSMLAPPELARVAVPHGTTTLVADPHEITNVLGAEGVEYMLESSRGLPMDFLFMLPSCVPATHMETAGAEFRVEDMLRFKGRPRILGLAEMMNFPGVVGGMEEVLEKLAAFEDCVRDGHAPLLSGRNLNAYLFAGAGSDHECTQLEEAREKLSKGMRVMIRQGTQARDLATLVKLVTPSNSRRTMLVTDDRHPHELMEWGHVDHNVRLAVREGLDPVLAVQMATINPAEYFRLRDRGAVAPGFAADLLIVDDLREFPVDTVIKNGEVVCTRGRLQRDLPKTELGRAGDTVHVGEVTADRFGIEAKGATARVIRVIEGRILTGMERVAVKSKNGDVLADPESDVVKLAVVERHRKSGRIGKGLVSGLGLKSGALASSVAHDSHNIVVAGVDDRAMATAVRAIREMGGGLAAASEDRVLATVPLPVAGLMSLESAAAVAKQRASLIQAVRVLGCALEDPFMALSFLALPVIPELKLTDRGLVDVNAFSVVPLFD
ncbi:MAG: adenine deaminase [Deltaproteobacteria bacterium]|nr:adenine deaminase [Deltaproteobacteria bacterium]